MLRWRTMRRVSLAAALVSASLIGCATTAPKAPRTAPPAGPPTIQVWFDRGRWHVRLMGPPGHRFQGSVAGVRGGILDLSLSAPALKDRVALAGDAVQFDVESTGESRPPGFDLRVAGGCLHFDLYVDGRRRPERVHLGRRPHHPTHIPFERCP